MYLATVRWVLPFCAFALTSLPSFQTFAQSTTNSWTKPTSGYWEEPFWSLGASPAPGQSIMITNAGWKAVAIGNSTVVTNASSLTVEAIDVSSPVDSFNTLLLNYAGVASPLRITADLRVGTNSALVSYSSALQGATFYLNGVATFDQLSEASFSSQVAIGLEGGAGELDMLSGSFNAAQLVLSSDGSAGKLNQSGGTLQLGSFIMNGQSTLNLTNGVMTSGSFSMNGEGAGGIASVRFFGGSMSVSNVVPVGNARRSSPVASGNFVMSAGEFHSPGMTIYKGSLSQSGGTNDLGEIVLPKSLDDLGAGTYELSGGTLLSSGMSLGDAGLLGYGQGVFNQSGGVHRNTAGISAWGDLRHAQAHIAGTYNLTDGLLISPSIQLDTGRFTQTGGTNHVGSIILRDASLFQLSAGSISSSNASIFGFGGPNIFSYLRGFYTQTAGSHDVQSVFDVDFGGVAQLQGGWLRAPDIRVNGELELSGAAVTNSGTFTMLGTSQVRADGTYAQLGKLVITSGPSLLNLGSGATTLRFRDSRDLPWDAAATLVVTNWSGLANGGGTDRLYVGTTAQGLTSQQLARVRFANPAGMPAGTYPAVILATGEVVPAPRPIISFARSSGNLVISWSGNYQLLSSTNAAGPYSTVSGATGRYTNSFNQPQQFFVLQSP